MATTGLSLGTVSYDSVSLTFANGTTAFRFNPADSILYALTTSNIIEQYTLTTPGDISTAILAGVQFNFLVDSETSVRDFVFSQDGSSIYLIGTGNNKVYQFDLGTPWDVSTAIYIDSLSIVSPASPSPGALVFGQNGTVLLVRSSTYLLHYDLSTGWDITSAVEDTSKTIVISSEIDDILFSSDGYTLWFLYNDTEAIVEYYLSVPFDITTMVSTGAVYISTEMVNAFGMNTNSDGSKLYINSSTVAYQYTNIPGYLSLISTTTDESTATISGIIDFTAELAFTTDSPVSTISSAYVEFYTSTLTATTDSLVTAIAARLDIIYDTITEIVSTSDILSLLSTKPVVVVEGITLTDTQVISIISGIIERLVIGETISTLLITGQSVNEAVGILDVALIGLALAIEEGIDLTDLTVGTLKAIELLLEEAAVNDTEVDNIIGSSSLIEIVGLIGAVYRYFGGDITEGVLFTDTLLDSLLAAYIVEEGIDVGDNQSESLLLLAPITDGMSITDTTTLNAILQTAVEEGMIFATQFVHDGTAYSGWVMNSENFAVSNYDNYDFTSFGKLNGQYYGIKPDGLYLLEGTMDDASFITATITTAAMDFGTSNLKAVPQAYFGFTGDGEMVLKIKVDDDTETWYNMISTSEGIHNQRLKLSKGLQGRYFQFELVSQDNTTLELDTIELYPIVLKRKL